jgi:ABC-type nitrate/sulfonate/bicarbonate transport system substrate-binding protein
MCRSPPRIHARTDGGPDQSAILQTEQAIDILERDARFHVLVDLYTVEPDYFYGTYFAKKDWLTTHPDLAIRYLTGLIQAHRFMYQHKADTIRMAAKATGFTVGVIDKTYERLLVNNTIFPLNDGYRGSTADVYDNQDEVARVVQGKEPDLAQLVDRRPITQALEALGIIRP